MDRLENLDQRLSAAPRIAVVGGGWAGLAAAVHLSRANVHLSVFEASRNWGGRARTLEIEGKRLDNGQHILIGAYSECLRLMGAVGVKPEQALLRLPLQLHSASGFSLSRAPLPSPWHLVFGLLNARGFSWTERISALRFAHWCRRIHYRLEADESLVSLLRRRNQPERVRRELWEPLCVAALNTPVGHASAQTFLNVLRDSVGGAPTDSDLLLPKRSLGDVFPEPAAAYLAARGHSMRLGVAAERIERASQALNVNGEAFDAVVLAVGPQHAASLLPEAEELDALRAQIEALVYEPIYTCYLQFDSKAKLPASMLGFNDGLVQWAFDRGALDGHAGLIAAVISARGAHQDLERADLSASVEKELRAVIQNAGALQWSRVIAEKRATYSCRPNTSRPDNATAIPGLFLAGDYTASDYPATLEAAVRSGTRAATQLVRKWTGQEATLL